MCYYYWKWCPNIQYFPGCVGTLLTRLLIHWTENMDWMDDRGKNDRGWCSESLPQISPPQQRAGPLIFWSKGKDWQHWGTISLAITREIYGARMETDCLIGVGHCDVSREINTGLPVTASTAMVWEGTGWGDDLWHGMANCVKVRRGRSLDGGGYCGEAWGAIWLCKHAQRWRLSCQQTRTSGFLLVKSEKARAH